MDRLAEIPVGEQGETLKVTKEEVLRELKRTNAGKAAGPDRIKPGLLKTCAQQLCSILCHFLPVSVSMLNPCFVKNLLYYSSTKENDSEGDE